MQPDKVPVDPHLVERLVKNIIRRSEDTKSGSKTSTSLLQNPFTMMTPNSMFTQGTNSTKQATSNRASIISTKQVTPSHARQVEVFNFNKAAS